MPLMRYIPGCPCCRINVAWDGGIAAAPNAGLFTTHYLPAFESFAVVQYDPFVLIDDLVAGDFQGYVMNSGIGSLGHAVNNWTHSSDLYDELTTWLEAGGHLLVGCDYRNVYNLDDTLFATNTPESVYTAINTFLSAIGSTITVAGRDWYRGVSPTYASFLNGWAIGDGLTSAYSSAYATVAGGEPIIEVDSASSSKPPSTGAETIAALERIGDGILCVHGDAQLRQGNMSVSTGDPDYDDIKEFWRRFFVWTPAQIEGV